MHVAPHFKPHVAHVLEAIAPLSDEALHAGAVRLGATPEQADTVVALRNDPDGFFEAIEEDRIPIPLNLHSLLRQ